MTIRSRSLLISAMLVLVASCSFAAEKAPVDLARPKLGLVLEGGGALGLAHIGVIQYLEEHRIPVSYIAGTGRGAGWGVYATGRNAAGVRDVVKTVNWDEVISRQVPFKDLSYRRKEDAHQYPSTLEFRLRNGLQFPSGFNSGQQVIISDALTLPPSRHEY